LFKGLLIDISEYRRLTYIYLPTITQCRWRLSLYISSSKGVSTITD